MCAATAVQSPPRLEFIPSTTSCTLVLSPLHPDPDQPAVERCILYAAHTAARPRIPDRYLK